jgi:hypothetical protein
MLQAPSLKIMHDVLFQHADCIVPDVVLEM